MTKLLIRCFIKEPDVHSAKGRSAFGNLSGFIGIGCNLVLFLLKMAAGLMSGSISILADAFNNFSDMGSSLLTMFGFKLSSKPADKEHPYGHGRLEYMTGFLVSVLIVLVGFELFKSAIGKILSPVKIDVTIVTVVILVASILVKLWMYVFNRKLANMLSSATIRAAALDSLNDVIATSAVLATTLIYRFTGFNLDGIAGLLVSGFILYGGFTSAVETVSPLLGEPPSQDFVRELKERVMSYDLFTGVHDLIVHDYGPGRCFASIHIEVPVDVDILKCHETIDRCEKEVGEAMGILLVAHMDPVDNGQEAQQYKQVVLDAIAEIDPDLSIHDFRVVRGDSASNLIFDVVLPFDKGVKPDDLVRQIQDQVSKREPSYHCVINVDNDYV